MFDDLYGTVIGSQVAKSLGYEIGSKITVAHGGGNVSFAEHDDKPFTVVGILKPTGTPVDRTVTISLEGIEAIHIDWKGGAQIPGFKIDADSARKMDLSPKVITAFMLGLNSRISTFKLQREINEYKEEPLLAIIPGVALQELWNLMSVAEKALFIITIFVIVIGLVGMQAMILSGLNERRREMAILRSNGARPLHIIGLLTSEATLLACLGVICGVIMYYLLLMLAGPIIENRFGLLISMQPLSGHEIGLLAIIIGGAILMGLIPAYRAYKNTLSDGITIRV